MITASAQGAGTVINAIATLKGSAFGINLKTYSEVEIVDKGIKCEIADNPTADTSLIAECARLMLAICPKCWCSYYYEKRDTNRKRTKKQ